MNNCCHIKDSNAKRMQSMALVAFATTGRWSTWRWIMVRHLLMLLMLLLHSRRWSIALLSKPNLLLTLRGLLLQILKIPDVMIEMTL